MPSVVARLHDRGLIHPPPWLPGNVIFEGMTGSVAYGCNETDSSDRDIVGICIPKKRSIFPHLDGHIPGFGPTPNRFDVFQAHHVREKDTGNEYDLAIYSIVRFFDLAARNNPNILELLFLPARCVRKSSLIYDLIRQNRRLFVHKGLWHKFRGYAYSQLHKVRKGSNRSNPKRRESVRKFGFDTKFAYHIVRLLLESEQLLETGEVVLDRDREVYKSIRARRVEHREGSNGSSTRRSGASRSSTHLPTPRFPTPLRWPRSETSSPAACRCTSGDLRGAVGQPSSGSEILQDLEDLVAKHRRTIV